MKARSWPGGVLVVTGGTALLFLALPVAALLVAALDGGVIAALTSPALASALSLSAVTTAASLLLTVVFGTPLALMLARRSFRGSGVAAMLVDLPLVLPPSVAGLALLLVFGARGPLGEPLAALGLAVPFTTTAVVLAQLFVSAPFYIRAAAAGFAAVERDVEDAARVDGADELRVLRKVTLPLARPALAAGVVMAWARALSEFGATIMFAGSIAGTTETLPLLVYADFQSGDVAASLAAAAILLVAAAAVLGAFRLLHWTLEERGVRLRPAAARGTGYQGSPSPES